jgi:hypothetical protein
VMIFKRPMRKLHHITGSAAAKYLAAENGFKYLKINVVGHNLAT